MEVILILYRTHVNIEFEAKVVKYLMREQAGFGKLTYYTGTNFETMDKYLSPNGIDINMPSAETIRNNDFQAEYMRGAEDFKNFNIINNLGNSYYREPTEQSPKSLLKLFAK